MENNEALAKEIEQQALSCGYTGCGIISLEDMDGYKDRLAERMKNVPESVPFYSHLLPLTHVRERFLWAKSLIICTTSLARFRYPPYLRKKYAKAFLLSPNSDPDGELFQKQLSFRKWLEEKGIRWDNGGDDNHGQIGGLRYAAVMAGLGIIRQNNFFYDETGSFVQLDGFAIDAKCRLYHQKTFRPCSEHCGLCRKACPSHALKAPYTMNPLRCVSFCNTFGGGRYPEDMPEKNTATWTIGCDACQDACPYNRRKNWDKGEPFSGLEELLPYFDLEYLSHAPDEVILEKILPKTANHLFPNQLEQLRAAARRALGNMETK